MGMRVVTLVTRVRVPNLYNVNPTMMGVTTSSSVGFWPMALITPNSSWAEIAPLPSWTNTLKVIYVMDGLSNNTSPQVGAIAIDKLVCIKALNRYPKIDLI